MHPFLSLFYHLISLCMMLIISTHNHPIPYPHVLISYPVSFFYRRFVCAASLAMASLSSSGHFVGRAAAVMASVVSTVIPFFPSQVGTVYLFSRIECICSPHSHLTDTFSDLKSLFKLDCLAFNCKVNK